MQIFLILWFALTFFAFIAYVVYDLKVSPPLSSDKRNPVNPVAPREQASCQLKRDALSTLNLIYRQANHGDWQQAVANLIASLKISASENLGLPELVEPRHSFPRHMVLGQDNRPVILDDKDLYKAVKEYRRVTGRSEDETWQDLYKQLESFLDTRDSLREPTNIHGSVSAPIELRPDLREKIQEVRRKYSFFNGSKPLHEEQLKQIFEAEDIDVLFVEDLHLLSLFVEYSGETQKRKRAVVIRKDDIHQALKEFLLGHELGHWFLHFESGFAERFIGENYYLHSSLEWQPLEFDADTFAMTALFPTSYLADCEIYQGTLSEEKLFEDFTAGMEPIGEGRLKDNMLKYIRNRIWHYHQFKEAILPVRTPVTSIQEEDVKSLLRLSENADPKHPVNWVQMDEQFVITRASNSFIELFGLPKETVLGKLTPLDLVIPEEREPLRDRFRHRRDRLKAIFYFTRVVSNGESKGRRVAVYSFPILRGKEYVGSIGYLILPEQLPSITFHPEAIHLS